MPELTLMIIRHAEKPHRVWPGPGLTKKGRCDEKSLVIRGWQRAGAWAALFGTQLGGANFPQPDVIYAADPSSGLPLPEPGLQHGRRPFETVRPLAKALGLKPVTRWAVGHEKALIKEIKALSGVVLVCWEHKRIISHMLPAIADGHDIRKLPQRWKGKRFDVVLRFNRQSPTAAWSFRQLFPRLMPGDLETPVEDRL